MNNSTQYSYSQYNITAATDSTYFYYSGFFDEPQKASPITLLITAEPTVKLPKNNKRHIDKVLRKMGR
jgi:hypothetical protein